MLADKDRIFTNLYGWGDAGLKGAQARGDWDNTKAILARGHDDIIEEMKSSDYTNLVKTIDKYFGEYVIFETANKELLNA